MKDTLAKIAVCALLFGAGLGIGWRLHANNIPKPVDRPAFVRIDTIRVNQTEALFNENRKLRRRMESDRQAVYNWQLGVQQALDSLSVPRVNRNMDGERILRTIDSLLRRNPLPASVRSK